MTPDQRMAALLRANRVRAERRRAKEDLRAGRLAVRDALRLPAVASMTVGELLVCLRGWGPVRVRRVLGRASVTSVRRLRDLRERERVRLLAECDWEMATTERNRRSKRRQAERKAA